MELFKQEVNQFLRPTDNKAMLIVCLLCLCIKALSVLQ